MSIYQPLEMFYGGKKFYKMIRLIDYLFYRIAFLFDKFSSVGIVNSISIISIVQTWNLLAITKLFFRIINKEFNNSLLSSFIVFFVLFSLNSIRYFKFIRYKDLHYLWKDEERKIRAKGGLLIMIYIMISLVFYIVI